VNFKHYMSSRNKGATIQHPGRTGGADVGFLPFPAERSPEVTGCSSGCCRRYRRRRLTVSRKHPGKIWIKRSKVGV
jgi:hypothetical protein